MSAERLWKWVAKRRWARKSESRRRRAYSGHIDQIRQNVVVGWVYDSRRPNHGLEIEVSAGKASKVQGVADRFREDLLQAGIGNGRHGFEIELAANVEPAQVRIQVRDSDYVLQQGANEVAEKQREQFHNSAINDLPIAPWGFSERSPGPSDQQVAAEIIARWRRFDDKSGPNSPRKAELWDTLVADQHATLLSLVEAGDAPGLARYLSRIPMETVGEGVLQGERAYLDLTETTDSGRDFAAAISQDSLVSLAQYLGVARIETTEQGPYGEALHTDTKKLAKRIRAAIGISVAPPTVFSGLFGLRVDDGIVEGRSLQALYAALRVKSVLGDLAGGEGAAIEPAKARICEIGAGFAQVAGFAWRLGFRHYTIVDLPSMMMMQQYALRMSLPDATIKSLRDDEDVPSGEGVYLVSAASYARRTAERYDLTLNCDSFPEMGEEVCSNYFDLIAKRSRLLLSINQEANGPLTSNIKGPRQPVVAEMLGKRTDFSRLYRFRTWIRKGYAEELWRPRSQG